MGASPRAAKQIVLSEDSSVIRGPNCNERATGNDAIWQISDDWIEGGARIMGCEGEGDLPNYKL